jgi:hypothetical protein
MSDTETWEPLPPDVQHALHLLMMRFPAWTDTFPVGRRPDAATLSARMMIITSAFANAYRLRKLTLECFEVALMKPFPEGMYFLCDRCEGMSELRNGAGLEWWQRGDEPPELEKTNDASE